MKRTGLAGIFALIAASSLGVGAAPASAVGICKCDSSTGFEQACLPLCKQANEKTRFFRPAVYFGNDPKVSRDPHPLNGTSLKFLYLSKPTRQGMESFRVFLEKHRKIAEQKFQKVRRAYKRGKVDAKTFKQAEKQRDEALVNYQHGMRAYLTTPSKR